MMPSFSAFADELEKCAEEAAPQVRRPNNRAMFSQALKNSLQYGAGFGLGTGTGYLMSETVLPKLLPKLSPQMRTLVGSGVGALTTLGTMAAWRAAQLGRAKEQEAAWAGKTV